MIHYNLSSYPENPQCGAHFGVNVNASIDMLGVYQFLIEQGEPFSYIPCVLVQLGDDEGQQARVKMTPDEAEEMAKMLLEDAAKTRVFIKEVEKIQRKIQYGKLVQNSRYKR